MEYSKLFSATLILSSTAALAVPTITGNTISWPDDGWYQVQVVQDTGIFAVCEGGLSCVVEPGEYIVVNHSTGERFIDLLIDDASTPSAIPVSVTGTTISWPDNGWYQVQDSRGLVSLCNGTLFCTVDPGSYIVINHTTGQRYEHVEVPASQDSSGVTVVGNTIFWTENGWYQVQRADNYHSVCQSTSSCAVAPGNYIVINHTNGKRYENISVGDTGTAPLLIREDTWEPILAEVVAIANSTSIDNAYEQARMFGNEQTSVFRVGDSIPGANVTLTANTFGELTFSCDAGGSISAVRLDGYEVQPLNYTAKDCRLTDGLLDGTFSFRSTGREGSGISVFEDYSRNHSENFTFTLDGTRQTLADRIGFAFSRSWQDTGFSIAESSGITLVENFNVNSGKRTGSMDPYTFYVLQSDGSRVEASHVTSNAYIGADFTVSAPWSANARLQVDIDMRYDGDFVSGGGEFNDTGLTVLASAGTSSSMTYPLVMTPSTQLSTANWNRGEMTIKAPDGSSVSIFPDTGDFNTFYVSVNSAEDAFLHDWSDALKLFCKGPFGGCSR